MQAAILFLLLVVICLQIFIILVIKQSFGNASEDSGNAAAPTQEQQKELLFHIQQNLSALSQSLKESQQQAAAYQNQSIATLNQNLAAQMQQMEQRLRTIELTNGQGMEQVRQTIQTSLNRMQQVQADNLAEIQGVVEQKLTQTLEQKVQSAFQMVNERLEMVYRGLGEMQTLAAGVGDLKKVLSAENTLNMQLSCRGQQTDSPSGCRLTQNSPEILILLCGTLWTTAIRSKSRLLNRR
mgnify:CR=1 FL=1